MPKNINSIKIIVTLDCVDQIKTGKDDIFGNWMLQVLCQIVTMLLLYFLNNIILFMLLPEKDEMTIIIIAEVSQVSLEYLCVQGSMSQWVSAVIQTHKMKAKILK